MAQKMTIDEYKGLSDSAKAKVPNDDLAALAKSEGVALETDDNKADMIRKIDAKVAADSGNANNAPDNGGDGGKPMHAGDGSGDNGEANTGDNANGGWGNAPPAPAASGNGDHLADDLPPAVAVGGSPVENDGPGQGRVTLPDANADPADTPVGAAPQDNPNTAAHHDASAAGQGPGGTTLDPETAERTGAAIADPDARPPVGGSGDYVNDLARHTAGEHNSPTHRAGSDADAEQAYDVGNNPQPKFTDMLAASLAISANLAAAKAPVNPNPAEVVLPDAPRPFEVEPHPNEKLNDAIGSTHDVGGREVVKVAEEAEGLPVYVGTAQPVERPDAQWRANTAS